AKVLNKNVARTKNKAIRIINRPFLSFVKEMPEMKYTSFFVEPQNSRTAVIPVFSSNLSLDRLKQISKKQQKLISELYRSTHRQASLTYVTHSIDHLENEEIFQSTLQKAYYENQEFSEEIRKLKQQKIISSRAPLEIYKEIEKELTKSSVYLDPITTNNTGGFIAKFNFKLKQEEK
ncbi:MAG: hypothetical protein ACTSPF_10310, partial [Candidatus Heimdallarchaeaceae archaeon]